MSAKVVAGTSGYSYSDWVGPFYPAGMKQGDFLSFYSQHFTMIELNFTYYRQPEQTTLRRMAQITAKEFGFSIKAHRTLTHEIDLSATAKETQTFIKGIEPVAGCGKLISVLFQFPFSFHYTSDNRIYLDSLFRGFGETPLAVEFRNREWLRDTVFNELKDRKITFVNVDEPRLENLPLPSSRVTSDTGYVRFHGRNKENWWSGDNVSRYDYLYSDKELAEWIPGIKEMVERTGVVLLVFNNHSKGYAVNNALRLKEMVNKVLEKQ